MGHGHPTAGLLDYSTHMAHELQDGWIKDVQNFVYSAQ
jgi:hypothetical protein